MAETGSTPVMKTKTNCLSKIKSGVMKKILSLIVLGSYCWLGSFAQDTTEVAVKEVPKQKFARATFNSTQIINMQSTEIIQRNALQFMVAHHFSYIWNEDAGSQNLAQLFGLNSGVAHTYLSFDYSPTDFMNLGLAAAGSSKYEGWAKFRILRQQTGLHNVPVSVSWYSMAHVNTAKDPEIDNDWNKFSFMHQLLISRKMSDKFSLQLMPTVIHFNVVPYGINNSNLVWSMGVAGKYKMKPKMNLTFEYSRQFNMFENIISKNGSILNYNPDLMAVGLEFNTGGHLFQFYVGNTTDASAIDQLARNTSKIKDGNFALGFRINRTMDLKKEKE